MCTWLCSWCSACVCNCTDVNADHTCAAGMSVGFGAVGITCEEVDQPNMHVSQAVCELVSEAPLVCQVYMWCSRARATRGAAGCMKPHKRPRVTVVLGLAPHLPLSKCVSTCGGSYQMTTLHLLVVALWFTVLLGTLASVVVSKCPSHAAPTQRANSSARCGRGSLWPHVCVLRSPRCTCQAVAFAVLRGRAHRA